MCETKACFGLALPLFAMKRRLLQALERRRSGGKEEEVEKEEEKDTEDCQFLQPLWDGIANAGERCVFSMHGKS